jgi:hypothetical protein
MTISFESVSWESEHVQRLRRGHVPFSNESNHLEGSKYNRNYSVRVITVPPGSEKIPTTKIFDTLRLSLINLSLLLFDFLLQY